MSGKGCLSFERQLTDYDRMKLDEFKKEVDRMNLLVELAGYEKMKAVYEKRRALTKTIPKFWAIALIHHSPTALALEKEEDQEAIQYLEEVWVRRNPVEPRAYTLEFTFSDNPFFEDRVLEKEFRFVESQTRKEETADGDGFKWSMLDFDWEEDIQPQPCYISWKPGKDLSQQFPIEDDGGDINDLGSFFNWFLAPSDALSIGTTIADEVFPNAIRYFTGELDDTKEGENDEDENNEDENENGSDEEENDEDEAEDEDESDEDEDENDEDENENGEDEDENGEDEDENNEDDDESDEDEDEDEEDEDDSENPADDVNSTDDDDPDLDLFDNNRDSDESDSDSE